MDTFGRQYWLWVTRPEYYANDDGSDREDLDPQSGIDSDGWWTCQPACVKSWSMSWRASSSGVMMVSLVGITIINIMCNEGQDLEDIGS